ncbi:fatty acid--CoA ligase [Cytobacillus oceanisediminis]
MLLTLSDHLDQSAAKNPGGQAWVHGDRAVTYTELVDRTAAVARALLMSGLDKGDRCAFLLRNRGEVVDLWFGMARVGVVAVPVNFRSVERELLHVLHDAEPRLLLVEPALLPVAAAARERDPELDVRFVVLGTPEETPAWAETYDDWLAAGSGSPIDARTVDPDSPFFIGYTSGTTGRPKGAVVPHRGLVRNSLSLMLEYRAPSERDDRFLTLMPMFHSNSTWFGVTCAMAGATNVISPDLSFDASRVLGLLESERITHTSVVPTMLKLLVDLGPEALTGRDLSHLRRFLCGSAPISVNLKRSVEELLGCEVGEGYGATETGIVSSLRTEDPPEKKASVGRPVVGAEVEIRDPFGRVLPAGEVGEVWIRGETILLSEYWRNPAATASTLEKSGWCSVGDMGCLDEDGYLFLADRKNDLIISGGENVYPSEVEGVLLTHDAVAESAVVGRPDERWGEIVRAVVSLRPGHETTAEEIQAHCRRELAAYKIPRVVEFVDELPKNPTGKILRRVVRDQSPQQFPQQ